MTQTMKAMIYRSYGPAEVIEPAEVARPEPGEKEVLVEVHATTVTTADWRLRAAAFPGIMWLPGRLMFGLFRPRKAILGGEFAGRVAARGGGVTRFAVGDRVFGFCGHGAHAEYLAVPEQGAIAPVPEGLGYAEAAAVPFGALAALVFLRDFGRVRPGQRVLVNGASGGVGAYAVQIARQMGAEVTGVCSAGNAGLVRSLGAARVLDYATTDFTEEGVQYDVILDTVGTTDFRRCRRSLTGKGRFIPLNFGLREMRQALATSFRDRRKVMIGVNGDTREDLEQIGELLEAGRIRPVIDTIYPFEAIAEAHRHVEGRHRKGSVVVDVREEAAADRVVDLHRVAG